MITLSFGFKKPETGDLGPIVFPALEGNIQQLNDHNHDGSNTAKIPSSSITPLSATLAAGSWVSQGDGLYKQTVTVPAAVSVDTIGFDVRLANGDVVYPTIKKVAANQIDVFTNDNSVGMTILYN